MTYLTRRAALRPADCSRSRHCSGLRGFTLALVLLELLTGTLWAEEKPIGISIALLNKDTAVAIALENNPNLAEIQARYEAMKQIPSQVGTLPDPVISFNALNLPVDSFDRSQEGMTQMQFGVSQSFPFPGKLALREQASEFEAEAAGHNVDEVRLKLIKDVQISWWNAYYLDRTLETILNNEDLLRQFIKIAETKYATGLGLQQDVLLAQLELSKLLDQEIRVKALRRDQSIRLNTLMDVRPDRTLALPDIPLVALPDLADESTLYTRAESARPLLAQLRMEIAASQSRLKLAKKNYYPDFNFGIAYGNRTGDNPPPRSGSKADFLSAKLSMNVPIYRARKLSKAVSQRTNEVMNRRYSLQDELGMIRSEISSSVVDYTRAREQYLLFKDGIIPQAQQTVSSMLAGYQVSEVDFLNLVRAQVTLYNYQIQNWKAYTDANQAMTRLIAAVGEDNIHE